MFAFGLLAQALTFGTSGSNRFQTGRMSRGHSYSTAAAIFFPSQRLTACFVFLLSVFSMNLSLPFRELVYGLIVAAGCVLLTECPC
mmetsp:Transcript_23758/g.39261  ORF Transcript_23758/g.39261 Transcript_23758/m.39261 type:complete len:86 (-) Transcript_23758:57-314(-)